MIFSIFGKKNGGKKSSPAKSKTAKDDSPTTTSGLTANTSADFANSIMAQRHIARATERKIDAIEYEMSRDILKKRYDPPPASTPITEQPDANANLFDDDEEINTIDLKGSPYNTDQFQATLPLNGAVTDFMLNPNTEGRAAHAAIENIPALEEAAILFASEQIEAAELILMNLIQNESYNAMNPSAWLMLFDLYQITNSQAKFEQLSLDYVSKLEISAPIWQNPQNQVTAPKEQKGFVPGVSFSGKLNAQLNKQIEKLQILAKQNPQLRLEFVRITELDVAGCELLLKGFLHLKKTKNELTIVGAHDLIKLTRSLVAVGRKDESDAPWLLLLELLQLINDETAFEEASIDYCITYEVSPPSFEAPKNKATAPSVGISIEFVEADRFLLPKVIEGNTQELIDRISKFALDNHSVQLNCSQLDRIDFSSCGQLLSGLVPLSKQLNVSIEFHDVNHLVIALLNAMGFKNIAVIFPRKR
ncbi:ABC-type transporter Mla MlaB component [Oxalobacteraceae bacterium GrIS 2.11]